MTSTVTYGITEEIYSLGTDSRTAYGIVAYADAGEDGTTTVFGSVHDITSDRENLKALVDTCNRLKLSTVHLQDVIEDFLAD